jgi:N-acetylneuraminic acid mutarotase
VPSARSGHTVCTIGSEIYLFGGCGRSAGVEEYCLNDLHALNTRTLRWQKIGESQTAAAH